MNRGTKRLQKKIITLERVGKIVLERSRRAKNLSLSVRPYQGVRVAVPMGVSFQQAREMAISNVEWIAKQLHKTRQVEHNAVQVNRHGVINRAVARRIIVSRLETLACRHGFTYRKVFVRNQKTRWGSCSMQNNINLNIHLIFLPAILMDYVILHELVHTRIKDHSTRFWSCLGSCLHDPKALDSQLTRYEVLLAGGANP